MAPPKSTTSPSKLDRLEDIDLSKRDFYQREQRRKEKNQFRQQMGEALGDDFVVLAESFREHGLGSIRDFVGSQTFESFMRAYDDKISKGGAKSDTFGFTFHNFAADKDFLTDSAFKETFSHPLLIALTAYAMGGPVRLVDVRGKNADPGLTMVRDNGPHVDDNPFNDEWKLLITWGVNSDGVSQNTGPQGQPFVSIPGTEQLVRRDTTEYGANFKNPEQLLDLISEQARRAEVEKRDDASPMSFSFMEAKDERPLFTIFEASHQVHHRKRSPDEPPRGCMIFAYHLVDQESKPGRYFSDDLGLHDPLDRFVMGGELMDSAMEDINQQFIQVLQSKKGAIDDKMKVLRTTNKLLKIEDKMMGPEQVVDYFRLLMATYKKDFVEANPQLRLKLDDLRDPKAFAQKLHDVIGEADKHYDLDLIIYPDKREQIRKVPRTEIRESARTAIGTERFADLKIPEIPLQPFTADAIEEAREKAAQYAQRLCPVIEELLRQRSEEIKKNAAQMPSITPEERAAVEVEIAYADNILQLLADIKDKSHHPDIDSRSKRLRVTTLADDKKESSPEKKLIEMYQLTQDLGDAFSRCDDLKSLRAHTYFLYLVHDKLYNDVSGAEIRSHLDKQARDLLQDYSDLVVRDDLTYGQVRTEEMSDHDLAEKLAYVRVKVANGQVKPFRATMRYKQMIASTVESKLAEAMLHEASHNAEVKSGLVIAGRVLNEQVFEPFRARLFALLDEKQSISQLSRADQNLLTYFVNENSTQNRQRLGIFRDKTPQDILADPHLLRQLMTQIQANLLNGEKVNDLDSVERTIKAINEVACCYIEHLVPGDKDSRFLVDVVMPSPEEAIARIKPEELGDTGRFAVTTSTRSDTANHFVPKDRASAEAFMAGKSAFSSVDSVTRAKLEYEKLDALWAEYQRVSTEGTRDTKIITAQQAYEKQRSYIEEKKILRPEAAKATHIERLAARSGSPLLAGESASAGRTLAALYLLGAFHTEKGLFTFDRERMISNCVMAGLIHGGHHSFIELAEPHNRLLDAIAIQALERGDLDLVHRCQNELFPVYDVEPSGYPYIFHASYRDRVKSLAEGGADISVLPVQATEQLASESIEIDSKTELSAAVALLTSMDNTHKTNSYREIVRGRGKEEPPPPTISVGVS